MRGNKNSLKHDLRVLSREGVTDNHTIKSYRQSTDAFSRWAKGEGIRALTEVNAEVIQKYERYLEERYSAATIHTKIAPICKAAGVSMREIIKPRRSAGKLKRGRAETQLGRGEREEGQARFHRLVSLQRAVGIRRAELASLTGADWDGVYITVRRGKGGKSQRQFVLPQDRETVARVFEGVGAQERVFSAEEMQNHINLHKMRAEHARACYKFYADRLSGRPDDRERMRAALMRRFDEANARLQARDPGKYQRIRERFKRDVEDDSPYILRGENKRKAEDAKLPVIYDRLALLCVSVYHLSHWRLDVTTTNYMVP